MKIFKNGVAHDFEKGRSVAGIVRQLLEFKDNKTTLTSPVVHLSANNFTDYVKSKSLMMINFCDINHMDCKKLRIHYKKAAEKLSAHVPSIPLAYVDVIQDSSLATEYKIETLPALKVFRHGRTNYNYLGPQDEFAIVSFMKEQVGPPAKKMNDIKELKRLIDDRKDIIIVGYFQNMDDPLLKAYTDAGNDELRHHFQMFFTTNKEILADQSVSCKI